MFIREALRTLRAPRAHACASSADRLDTVLKPNPRLAALDFVPPARHIRARRSREAFIADLPEKRALREME